MSSIVSESQKHQTTPPMTIVEELPHGLGTILAPPLDNIAMYTIVELATLPDKIPFPKHAPRVYDVANVPWAGNHSHKPSSERELMRVVAGQAMVHLWDRQGNYGCVTMQAPSKHAPQKKMLYIPDDVWHVVTSSYDYVLSVVASTVYDRACYVTDPREYFSPEGLNAYMVRLGMTFPREFLKANFKAYAEIGRTAFGPEFSE